MRTGFFSFCRYYFGNEHGALALERGLKYGALALKRGLKYGALALERGLVP